MFFIFVYIIFLIIVFFNSIFKVFYMVVSITSVPGDGATPNHNVLKGTSVFTDMFSVLI